jgi:hypothetical protein
VAGVGGQQRDFFVSNTSTDRAWAEWVAWQLEQADRTLALLSQAYLASPYATDEWTGAFLHDKDRKGRLLSVRVEACELPRLLATRVYIDLVGLGRGRTGGTLAEREPGFPGERRAAGGGVGEPRFPAHGPR